jgi:uncharacterized membrane protein SpoIIM required for sporulation
MLESLLDFKRIDERPYIIVVWGFLVCSIGTLFSTQLVYEITISQTTVNLSGIFAVLFTLIPSIYFITILIKREEAIEEIEIEKHHKKTLWQRHGRDITLLMMFFIGTTLAFSVWTLLLPRDVFQIQSMKIGEIRSGMTGQLTSIVQGEVFNRILINNLQVMFFSFIFSLLFGGGAVFILVWNSSILGVFIGQLSKNLLEIPINTMRFMPHGIPEIGGYVCASLAGGILSAAILREHHKKKIFESIVMDSLMILGLGILLIFCAACIEVYI